MYYFQMLLNGLSLGAVYAIIALGFTLIYSILKFSNFSHGGIMVVCAYFAYVIQRSFQLNFVSMMLITAAFGAILACLVQFVGFENLRAKRSNIMLYFVSSSTLGVLLQNIIVITFSSTYYAYPAFFTPPFVEVNGFTFSVSDMIMLGISAVVIIALMFLLYRTRLGISIRALSMDSETVKLMGINVSVVVALTFMISGALAAVAGIFCGVNYILYPQLNQLVFKGMIASILGGLGNISGALYGGIMLGVLEVCFNNAFGAGLVPVFSFVFSMIFLLVRPQGIAGKYVLDKV